MRDKKFGVYHGLEGFFCPSHTIYYFHSGVFLNKLIVGNLLYGKTKCFLNYRAWLDGEGGTLAARKSYLTQILYFYKMNAGGKILLWYLLHTY